MALSYIESTLASGEEILGRLTMTKLQYFWSIIFSFVIIGIPFLIWTFISRRTTEIAYTNKRIITKTGVISRDTDEIKIDRIESIDIKQSILGRMFGFGTVIISGTGAKIIAIADVINVIEVRKALVSLNDGDGKES